MSPYFAITSRDIKNYVDAINDDGHPHDLFIAQGRFSILMKDSGKAAMGDDAFVIEKHLSAGVQVPESRLGFQKQLRVLPVGNPEYQTGREVVEKGFHFLSGLPAGEYQADSEPRSFLCNA